LDSGWTIVYIESIESEMENAINTKHHNESNYAVYHIVSRFREVGAIRVLDELNYSIKEVNGSDSKP
jgi:hypothetical protein